MRGFVPVVMACPGLLAGCGLIERAATPAETEASLRDRAAAVAKAWQDGGITRAWARGFVPPLVARPPPRAGDRTWPVDEGISTRLVW